MIAQRQQRLAKILRKNENQLQSKLNILKLEQEIDQLENQRIKSGNVCGHRRSTP